MGDARRAGRWRLPRRLSAWSVMGDRVLVLAPVARAPHAADPGPGARGDGGRARPVGRGSVRAAEGLATLAGRRARRTARRERNLTMTSRSTGPRDDGQV